MGGVPAPRHRLRRVTANGLSTLDRMRLVVMYLLSLGLRPIIQFICLFDQAIRDGSSIGGRQ